MSQQTLDSGLADENAEEDVACPTCGETFGSEHGMKIHHTRSHGESIATVTFDCDYCGDPSEKYKSKYKKADVHFCSDECHGNYRSEDGRVTTTCDFCGSQIDLKKSVQQRHSTHFCDLNCESKYKSRQISFECDNCGSEGTKVKSRYDRFNRHFCSPSCLGELRQTTTSNIFGSNWSDAEDYVRQRDNGVCQQCGVERGERALDIHHITPRRYYLRWSDEYDCVSVEDSNVPRNLISLCPSCHGEVELDDDVASPVPESHWRAE